ncbi:hypothetical protein CXG81DRAFT_18335 [Caulochytrium protostelioides]|uniref:Small ribosomal subunit protein bS18m n=1 Tax=Caulochytrium protostelioides TaxID=1555241 RepID=A0A4P9X9D5_9FUNG|nr:hypothetical protein CXG81DRAFT_18335 [Caulochytrium protostelioides]|eukprot:RKP01902.1 hypothetical protein CXG81DRAFT_18335 [Caulochytrium protostelioides]
MFFARWAVTTAPRAAIPVLAAAPGGMARRWHGFVPRAAEAPRADGVASMASPTASARRPTVAPTAFHAEEKAMGSDAPIPFSDRMRMFRPGDFYEPRDLDDSQFDNKRAPKRKGDFFKHMGLDPLKEYKNVALLSHYVTEMGMIQPRRRTGLTSENQARLVKAIRRARAMALMPFTYKIRHAHYEQLEHQILSVPRDESRTFAPIRMSKWHVKMVKKQKRKAHKLRPYM